MNISHKIKWAAVLSAIAFLFPFLAQAQTDSQSLLWKISGKGIQPSYLYGTLHMLPQSEFELKEKVQSAFDDAQQIVLELDMDDPTMQLEMLKYVAMTDGTTISSQLSEEDFHKLDSLLTSSTGMGAKMIDSWKPFFVSSFLMTNFIEGTPASFEMAFVQMAQQQDKEILGLETVQEQMAAVDDMTLESQMKVLKEMLNEEKKMRESFKEMINFYKEEDIEGLYDYSASYIDNPEELQVMLIDRNENWISRIGKLAAEKSTFFGVGAGHLGGEKGVVKLLKEAGYTVEAIK
ncbi:MAG: TraB/GumN family protein [Bacteroidota bacterium]